MKPKKFLRGSVGLALGIICILLVASLVGVIAYYTMAINSKDNELSTLDLEISELNATVEHLNATIIAQNNTINSLNAELQMARDGDASAQTAYVMANSGVLFVDVRTPDEYDIMHVNNSINVPYYNMTDFATRLAPLAGKQNTQMVLYCKGGTRSKNAWLYLNSVGYTEIYNMLGGIDDWRAMNYSVWEAPSGPISVTEARWMVDLGQGINGTFPNLIVIDVRDSTSYTIGHLPNATNIPYTDDFAFNETMRSVLSGKENSEIVVYCAGGGCELSSMASSVLIEDGFTNVYWMPDGFIGWATAGYLIVTPNGTTGSA